MRERLVDQIRERIAAGTLPLGSRLSDKELAVEMQVSRTPVREALLQLQIEGLIVVRPRSGTFVFKPAIGDLTQICQMRSLLETGALRLGVASDKANLIRTLTVPVSEAALAMHDEDYARCEELDTAFHETLIRLSENQYLIDAFRTISSKVRALRSRLAQNHERIESAILQHRRIVDLVVVGQVEAAALEIASHVDNVQRQLADQDSNLQQGSNDSFN